MILMKDNNNVVKLQDVIPQRLTRLL